MPAVDNATSNGATSTTMTFSHTCSGTNRCLYVGLMVDGAGGDAENATCTYNAVSMTKQFEHQTGNYYLSVFELIAPATGANDVVLTWTNSRNSVGIALSLTSVNQDLPITLTADSNGDATSVSNTVTSASGELVIDFLAVNDQAVADNAPDSGQTQQAELNQGGGSGCLGACSTEPGAASVSMGWSGWTVSERHVHWMASLQGSPGPAVVTRAVGPQV